MFSEVAGLIVHHSLLFESFIQSLGFPSVYDKRIDPVGPYGQIQLILANFVHSSGHEH